MASHLQMFLNTNQPLMTVFDTRDEALEAIEQDFGFAWDHEIENGVQWFGEDGRVELTLLVEQLTPGRWVVVEEWDNGHSFKTLVFPDAELHNER